MASSEGFQAVGGAYAERVFDSEISNAENSHINAETLEELAGESLKRPPKDFDPEHVTRLDPVVFLSMRHPGP